MSGLTVGDRLPDLRAPLADSSVFVLSEDAGGFPVALVVSDEVPCGHDDVVTIHVARRGAPTGRLSLCDDGRIAQALTDGNDGVVVAGPDHRVVATGPLDRFDALVATLRRETSSRTRGSATPLLIVDDVFERDLCDRLIAVGDDSGWVASPSVAIGDKSRGDHLLVDEELTAAVDDRLGRRLLPEITRSLAHRVSRHERYKLVRYPAGDGWFDTHRDNTVESARHRLLALTVNLDDSYGGGDLRFPELGPDLWRPRRGAALVFSCGLLHEVVPVTAGIRHAVVTFLF